MRPAYTIQTLDLSQLGAGNGTTGRQVISARANLLHMIDCRDANGNFSADGLINVQIGLETADAIPMRVNGKVLAETNAYVITWAQNPVQLLVTLLIAESVDGNEVDIDAPPAKQLVTSASGTSITTAQGTVNNTPTLVIPATGTRVEATFRNLGSARVYLGGPGVTVGQGFPVEPGDAYEFKGTTAAVYAISASGGAPYAMISEG